MPEFKCPLGVAEAEALATWLERRIADFCHGIQTEFDCESAEEQERLMDSVVIWAGDVMNEACDWADKVRPVKIGGVVMKEGR